MHLAVRRALKLRERPTGVSARSATRLPGEAHLIGHLALTLAVLAPQLGIFYAPRSRKHEPRVWWVPWWHVTPSVKPVGPPRLQAPSKGVPTVLIPVDRLQREALVGCVGPTPGQRVCTLRRRQG